MKNYGKLLSRKLIAFLTSACLLAGTAGLLVITAVPLRAQAAEKPVVIMIDPGHGGSNLGGEYNTLQEKALTMVTAAAMKEELEKYEGVSVCLTRNADIDMSLEERAQAAQDAGADYLFSLHYNMSADHSLYGSEVWIPSSGTGYAKGYSAGNLVLDELDAYGLFRRGVKTRVSSKGTDYYGVIRACTKRGIASMIIEHCHLDNQTDKPVYNSIPALQAFGRSDATAVAKYFGLKSGLLGVDYSNYPKRQTQIPSSPVVQDMTPPEYAKASVIYNQSAQGGAVGVEIFGSDRESGINYYSYSLDGGATWSGLQTMPAGALSVTLEFVPPDTANRTIVARVYNGYDKMTESQPCAY